MTASGVPCAATWQRPSRTSGTTRWSGSSGPSRAPVSRSHGRCRARSSACPAATGFSRYLLVFELADAGDGSTEVSARTFADFPGVRGRVYQTLVIGSHAHVLAVRGMLRSIGQSSLG